jgi:signal peptidase I
MGQGQADAGTGFFGKVQAATERFLSWRKRERRLNRERLKAKNPLVDWLEAFLWAAGVVLLINQYLFQAYQIPSGSMIDTLLVGDRIFVNKLVYGPELLPGLAKLPSPVKPKRNDVIIFESPEYKTRGAAFDICQRVIFMLTLSLVDIDRDEKGEQRVHFLIKRAAGVSGDVFRLEEGNMLVRFAGEDRWVAETDYNEARGWNHRLRRLMEAADYPALAASGRAVGYRYLGLPAPPALLEAAAAMSDARYADRVFLETRRLELQRAAMPHDEKYRRQLARLRLGWYVPEGRVLPLGDNRDSSHDGRWFGPVSVKKVLGKGAFKWWPPGRAGGIR